MIRDYKISIIRILAMISIVSCHIFQSLDMQIAFWLNVGVQVFLFMSGYLYGQKTIDNNKNWIIKQFKKILVPYYIYVLCIIGVYLIFASNDMTWNNVISLLTLQIFCSLPKGLGHLWFILIILACYMITPLLQKIIKSNIYARNKKIILIFIICILVEFLFFQSKITTNICNIICYILGYLIAYEKSKEKNKTIECIIIILAIITNAIKIFDVNSNNIVINSILNILVLNSHILLGSAIFIILYKLFKNINNLLRETNKKYIDTIDSYCYYIYITHHVFILGPLSLINITPIFVINLLIIIICIIISSYLLKKITDLIINKKNK